MTVFPITYNNAVKLKQNFLHLVGEPFSTIPGLDHIKIETIKIEKLPKGMATVLLYGYRDASKVDLIHRQLIDYIKEGGIEFEPAEYGF